MNKEIGVKKYVFFFFIVGTGTSLLWYALNKSPGIVSTPDRFYDFIIVGAGTAGCVLASRLSENSDHKILLIEAGGEESWISNIPMASTLLQKTKHDWQYRTRPQKHSMGAMHDQVSFWPRGKMLGGSGQINNLVHTFAEPSIFETWVKEFGATGWSYDEIKKYENKAECLKIRFQEIMNDQEYCHKLTASKNDFFTETKRDCQNREHETSQLSKMSPSNQKLKKHHRRKLQDGIRCAEPHIRKTVSDSILARTFVKAGEELGYPTGSLNENIDYGMMKAESSIFKGRRWSSLNSYLKPVMNRKNLDVLVNAWVTKIIWEQNRAVGVSYMIQGDAKRNGSVFSGGEVILSAGTINTPVILTQSGVGPKNVLEKLKIKEISILEGVGKNLQDHLTVPIYFSTTNNSDSVNEAKLGHTSTILDYFLYGEGALGQSGVEGVAILPMTSENPEIGILALNFGSVHKQIYSTISNIKPDLFDGIFSGMKSERSQGFILLAACIHPKSRGEVIVRSADPLEPILIEPNYLEDPYDLKCLREAYKTAIKISQTDVFKSLGTKQSLPTGIGCSEIHPDKMTSVQYEQYLNCIIKNTAITGYHPVGTVRIGKKEDAMAVVDSNLRVYRTENLRVVDASIFPTHAAITPNSVIIVIAEKVADSIKDYWKNHSFKSRSKLCSTQECEEIFKQFSRPGNNIET